jgi:hypothetical protein
MADAYGGAGGAGHQAAAEEPLAVDDEVVPGTAQVAQPAAHDQQLGRVAPPAGERTAGEGFDIIQRGVGGHGGRVDVLHQPRDVGIGPGGPQAGQHGHGPADIAQGAGGE